MTSTYVLASSNLFRQTDSRLYEDKLILVKRQLHFGLYLSKRLRITLIQNKTFFPEVGKNSYENG